MSDQSLRSQLWTATNKVYIISNLYYTTAAATIFNAHCTLFSIALTYNKCIKFTTLTAYDFYRTSLRCSHKCCINFLGIRCVLSFNAHSFIGQAPAAFEKIKIILY